MLKVSLVYRLLLALTASHSVVVRQALNSSGILKKRGFFQVEGLCPE